MRAKEVVSSFIFEQITPRHQDTSLVKPLMAKKSSVNQRNEFKGEIETLENIARDEPWHY